MPKIRSTTVLAVIRAGRIAMASDGQVTIGNTVVKASAQKVRRSAQSAALIGFAGGAADALALTERLEAKLEAHKGNVRRAAVELAKEWRADRVLRRLEAMLLVGDNECVLMVSGNGDVIEPEDGIAAVGSGGAYALAAARALARHTRARRRGDRARSAADRCGDLHLHQRQRDPGDAPVSGFRAFTPREVVSELDRYIVGQHDAKRAVAIALRNRWRRQQVPEELRDEIAPKNIIMIGPTGVGKTEIARRLAKMAEAPFLKVEASKFTEVGYVGRDVESIVRDLAEIGVALVLEEEKRNVRVRAERASRGAGARRADAADARGSGRGARPPTRPRPAPRRARSCADCCARAIWTRGCSSSSSKRAAPRRPSPSSRRRASKRSGCSSRICSGA